MTTEDSTDLGLLSRAVLAQLADRLRGLLPSSVVTTTASEDGHTLSTRGGEVTLATHLEACEDHTNLVTCQAVTRLDHAVAGFVASGIAEHALLIKRMLAAQCRPGFRSLATLADEIEGDLYSLDDLLDILKDDVRSLRSGEGHALEGIFSNGGQVFAIGKFLAGLSGLSDLLSCPECDCPREEGDCAYCGSD